MRVPIIGVMGAGHAPPQAVDDARWMGSLIARNGWITLSGGRDAGVMMAVSKAAREAGGLTLGILMGEDRTGASPDLTVAVCTGMGSARNNVNVLTADVVVAIASGAGAGTVSEVALAVKAKKHVLVLGDLEVDFSFFKSMNPALVKSVTRETCEDELQRVLKESLTEKWVSLPPLFL